MKNKTEGGGDEPNGQIPKLLGTEIHHDGRVSCVQEYCLTISAAASLLPLGCVHISTASTVIYGGGSVTTFNTGVEGGLTLSSWGGPQSISGLGKQLAVCPGLSQPDVLNKPVDLPPGSAMSPSLRVPMAGDCAHVCAVLQAMGLTKIINFPQKGLLFSAVISPFGQDRWRHCTSVHHCKGEGEGRACDGAGKEGSHPLPAADTWHPPPSDPHGPRAHRLWLENFTFMESLGGSPVIN